MIKYRNSNITTTLTRTDSKKKLGYNSLIGFKKEPSSCNVLSPSSKIAKQLRGSKMLKENVNMEPMGKEKKAGESQFLKKKKIVYNYLKNL